VPLAGIHSNQRRGDPLDVDEAVVFASEILREAMKLSPPIRCGATLDQADAMTVQGFQATAPCNQGTRVASLVVSVAKRERGHWCM